MTDMIDGHLLLKFAHILAFVYWLGADLGVYVIARQVANGALPLDERLRLMKLLMALDMFPRSMLIAILPLGFQLARNLGLIDLGLAPMAAIWVVGCGWFVLMWTAHLREKTPGGKLLKSLDLGVRWMVMALLAALGIAGLAGAGPVNAGWVALKLVAFAAIIALGLLLRRVVSRWIAGFALQATDKPQGDAIIIEAQRTGARFARMLWALLLCMGLLGTLKPWW